MNATASCNINVIFIFAGRRLYPGSVGPAAGLDSYKAYTVEYDAVEAGYMRDKGTHFDNAEITLNVSLTDEHEGGELYFVRWGEETPSFLSDHTNTTIL